MGRSLRRALTGRVFYRFTATATIASLLLGYGGIAPTLIAPTRAAAQEISASPTPTPTATATAGVATATVAATATASPTATPSPTATTVATGTATGSPTATPSPTATGTAAATSIPTATASPTAAATSTVEATLVTTATTTPTAPLATTGPTGTAGPTPMASTTASPSPAPAGPAPTVERLKPIDDPLPLSRKPAEGVMVAAEKGGVAYSEDGRASVMMGARALGEDTRIAVKRVAAYPPPGTRRLIGGVYDFSATQGKSGAGIKTFSKGVTISLTYRLEELGGTPESSLGIYYLNEREAIWEAVPSTVDRRGHVVTATVSHFSQYSIQGAPVDPDQPSFGSPANYSFDTPGYSLVGGPDNANFDTAGYVVPGGPENAGFDTPGFLSSIQPVNRDFENGDLSGWTLSGTGGTASGGYNDSYYVSLLNGAALTSDTFTIPSDAQTIRFWAYNDWESHVQLIRESDGAVLREITVSTGRNWREHSFNVSSFRGTAVKLRFHAWVSSVLQVDDVSLRQEIPAWETDADQARIVADGGSLSPYAQFANGTLTSSPFTIPGDALTIHFWANANSGSEVALIRASDGSTLRTFSYDTGGGWQSISFNVSSYRGVAVKLRFSSRMATDRRVANIQMACDVPTWESDSDQLGIGIEGGPSGPSAQFGAGTLTSSAFVIPNDAQTIHFWAYSNGSSQVDLLRASDDVVLVSLAYDTRSSWQPCSFNVSAHRGVAVKLRFGNGYHATTPDKRVDNIQLVRDIPSWEADYNQPAITNDGGPSGPYVRFGSGNLISSAFVIPNDAQTIHFWAYSNGSSQVDLLRASDDVVLVSLAYDTRSSWQPCSFNVSAHREVVVKLRFGNGYHATTPDKRVDNIQLDGSGTSLGSSPNVGHDGEPVNMTTGNYLYNHQDLAIPGRGLGLTLSRSYNSLGTGSSIFGNRWSFNYGMSLEVNADSSVIISYPDGRKVTYTRNSDGSYNRPTGVYDNLIRNGDGSFTLTTKGQAHFNFSADGRLISLVDRNGNTLSLAYRADGLLRSSTDPSGRTLTFSYGAAENAQVLATPTAVLAFPNADFEQGTYANWTTTGTAFGSAPSSYGDPGKQGTYQANSYRPLGSDTPVGTITSTGFVAGRQLLFRVGGGSDSSTHKVSLLLDDDTEVLTHSNTTSTAELRVVTWDTTPWEGQRVRLRAADTAAGGSWGWVSIDDVRVVYAPSGTVPAPLGNDVLPFANGNFEDGSYLNWFATGTAFGVRPITNSDAGREGGYYANSYDPTVSDAATATMTSAPFTASRSLSFLVNGGNKPDSTYVALVLADGTEVLKTTHAANTKVLDPVTWDTSPYEGQTVRIRLVDNDTTSWGWIGVDNVRILYGADLVQQVTDPAGAVYRYSYDPSGNLIAYTDPNGGTISYEYGPYGMTRATDQNGHSFVDNGYDVRGRVVEQLDALGNVTTFSYDVANRTTTYTDQLGNSRVYTFDSSGRTISVRDELGNTESYGYDSAGNRVAVTDRNGATIHYSYDAMGNVTSATDPSNATESYGYDAQNNPLTRTDALGRITRFAYDAAGNLVRTTDPLGHETAMAYDGFGQLTSTTDPLGNVTGYGYDAFGNQTAVTDSRGKTTQRQFDAAGRLIAQTDPLGHTTRYSYRADGQLLRTTDALDHEAGFTYDAVGNRTSATDPNGRTTLYGYDEADRLVSVTDPVGQTTSYGYDLVGRRTSTTDAMGRTTRYQLDASGRLVKETDPAGHSWEYSYTNTGNVLTRKDANLATTSYGYDANGRVSEVTYPVGQVTHQYDAAGRRTSSSGPAGALSYSYDELGRLAWVTDPSGATVSYGYDSAGRRTRLTYPDGKVATYGYDGDSRLTSVTDWLGKVTGYSYDDAGRLVSTTYPNGAVAARSYDDANRLVSIVAAKDGTTLASFGYTLDNAGMRTAVQTLAGTESYGYDSLYRFTSATYPDGTAQSYSYDPVGNRLTKVEGGSTTQYSYDAADWMTAAGGVGYGYDGNGNQISRGPDVFSWDYESQLVGATVGANSVTHSYRPDGLRHSKTIGGSTTTYVWDVAASLPVILQDGSNNYLYGLGPISQTDAAGNQSYFLSDVLGSTVALTDATGSVTAGYQYDAFGVVRNHSGPASTEFGFTGQQEDPTLGYQYLRARYYDPTIGRFIGRDPFPGTATNPASQNPYVYAQDNPVMYADPSGEFVDTILDVGFLAYDVYRIGADNVLGKKDNLGENVAALGADVAGFFIPGATGLGVVSRVSAVARGVGVAERAGTVGQEAASLERHHLLPVQFRAFFEQPGRDLKIDDFVIQLPKDVHRLKPGGLHTGPDNWNKRWDKFIEEWPDASKEKVLGQLDRMMRDFGLPR